MLYPFDPTLQTVCGRILFFAVCKAGHTGEKLRDRSKRRQLRKRKKEKDVSRAASTSQIFITDPRPWFPPSLSVHCIFDGWKATQWQEKAE